MAKYVDLKTNGRLFPSWLMHNFKKYHIPDSSLSHSKDPCRSDDSGQTTRDLRKYQLIASKYLDFKSPYRELLLYHGLGSGKTASAINVYNVLYNYTPGWNVFLLLKASLSKNWRDELESWLQKDEKQFRFKNIIFINYDSPIADKTFMDAVKNVDNAKKSIYIIEEAHNFIRNVYSNISSEGGKRAQIIYDYIIQDKKENPDTRIILLSGTPAINKPFELALLFNLLRPNSFPKSEAEFNQLFISNGAYQTINNETKNMFQRRIMGLVSYYIGATPDLYATKTIYYINVPMSTYQQDIYNFLEEIETKLALKAKPGSTQTYKSYTRQACNFVFPPISQSINGDTRPRPNKFRISEKAANKILEGDDKNLDVLGTDVNAYIKAMQSFIKGLDDYFEDKATTDANKKYTIIDDLENYMNNYKNDFDKFRNDKKHSELFNAMIIGSAKMTNIIFNIMRSPGPTIVYSNYVLMEGLEVFKIYLKYFGFYSFMETGKLLPDKLGYVEFHGQYDFEARYKGKEAFNMKENKNGNLIRIILISPAGSEGLSLKNVRQIHIMEPYWNEVRIVQMIGRGVRQCSHADLPMDQRHVDIFRYKSIRVKGEKQTTDQYIEDVARSKDSLIQSFLDTIKEVAFDCRLFKSVNMMSQEYKCFQFEEPSLFDKQIGPAYKENMNDDKKLDNGLNSKNAMSMKIKVMKIQAVKLISLPEEDKPRYSKSENYWYYAKSGVVYDFELHYPVGRVAYDIDGIPLKHDSNTFIIDYVIPIPEID